MSRNTILIWSFIPLLFILGLVLIPGFGSVGNAKALMVLAAILGIASIGQTLAILLGGIDLSIPAVIGLANVLTVRWYGDGLEFWLVVFLVLAIAATIGAFNAIASRLLAVHPLLITLAVSFIVTGLVLIYTEGETTGTVPDFLTAVVSPAGNLGPIPVPAVVLIWLYLLAALVVLEKLTVPGRYLYAAGANEVASRLALVPVNGIWILAYVSSACFAALTGIFLAGFSGGADVSVGQPYLFQTVATVVIGGTSLLGGAGSYARTFAGTLIITLITTLLIGLGYSDRVQQILLGVLIVAMVAIYGRESHAKQQI